MAAIRRNIVTDAVARQQYVQGVTLLKQEFLGPTTADFVIPGPTRQISTYDLFVIWHHFAMFTYTPPTQFDRNAAHSGPVFLPWHRFMLILLELQLQRVLNDQTFGLPYWDWAADGELSAGQQLAAPIWKPDALGGQGDPVSDGPFAFDQINPSTWRVRIATNVNAQLRQTDRGLRRVFARTPGVATLPRRTQVATALRLSTFDTSPWGATSSGFRNRLEGWLPANVIASLHNRVHVWVGGDMGPASSPNDPVFYLNHCNVDRIWAAWLDLHGVTYLPDQTAPNTLLGHRIDDAMHALLSAPATPRQMLDVATFYSYDSLTVV